MRFLQIGKRVFLFLLVNLLVMLSIGIICEIFHVPRMLGSTRFGWLLGFCLLVGMGGSFVSLALSRWMAKVSMGVQVIDPQTADAQERELLEIVGRLAGKAGLEMPEVGIYNSPEINAFATGPSRSQALVAVSAGLLNNMRESDVEGVLGHEITHVANGDMVTMALIQGVVNAIALFLSWALAIAITQGASRDDERGGGNFFMQWMLSDIFRVVFGLLGAVVVAWFSRWREFRADAGGARLAGRDNMIHALKTLEAVHEQGADAAGQGHPAFQALKISGKTGGLMALLADHPPLEERIRRLEEMK